MKFKEIIKCLYKNSREKDTEANAKSNYFWLLNADIWGIYLEYNLFSLNIK